MLKSNLQKTVLFLHRNRSKWLTQAEERPNAFSQQENARLMLRRKCKEDLELIKRWMWMITFSHMVTQIRNCATFKSYIKLSSTQKSGKSPYDIWPRPWFKGMMKLKNYKMSLIDVKLNCFNLVKTAINKPLIKFPFNNSSPRTLDHLCQLDGKMIPTTTEGAAPKFQMFIFLTTRH